MEKQFQQNIIILNFPRLPASMIAWLNEARNFRDKISKVHVCNYNLRMPMASWKCLYNSIFNIYIYIYIYSNIFWQLRRWWWWYISYKLLKKRKKKVAYIRFGFDFLFSLRWKKILHFFYSNMKDHIEAFIALVSTFRANNF